MDTYTEKKGDKGEFNDENAPTIRIVLKSQETQNLDYVTSRISALAREKNFEVKGPRFMPNKILRLTPRKSPCGEGTNTYDRFEMRIHSRIVDIKCPPNAVADITNFKIKPGVDINIKIWNN
jgi:small subunit ribosomal protein S20e